MCLEPSGFTAVECAPDQVDSGLPSKSRKYLVYKSTHAHAAEPLDIYRNQTCESNNSRVVRIDCLTAGARHDLEGSDIVGTHKSKIRIQCGLKILRHPLI